MKRITILFLILPVLIAGCSKKKKSNNYVYLPPSPSMGPLSAPKVFDPKMGGGVTADISYRVNPLGTTFDVTLTVVDDATSIEVRRLLDAVSTPGGTTRVEVWDGKNDSGDFVDPGTYKIVLNAVNAPSYDIWEETYIFIVRLGIVGIQFVDNGLGGTEYQMMYHIRNTSKYTYYAIPDNQPEWSIGPNSGEVADLDVNDGQPRALPPLWPNLNSPPQDASDPSGVEDDCYNHPICYRRASVPKFILTLGTDAASDVTPGTAVGCGYPVAGLPIRIISLGDTPEVPGANEDIAPAGTMTFVSNGSLPNGLYKTTISPTFRFEYNDGGTWCPIPGQIVTAHTIYTIHDTPALTTSPSPTPPYLPWVRVVDMVVGWVNSNAAAGQIDSIVTNQTNTFFGLLYDTATGAPGYTTPSFVFEMSNFIDDYDTSSFGRINCSDCACLVSTFANTVGINHQLQRLGISNPIPLNWMIPIGWDWQIPFGGDFSFHCVVTRDNGDTVSDACCTLDTDGDNGPGSSATVHTPVLPVDMDYATYSSLLSPSPGSWGTYDFGRCGQH
ncbi:MAG: hypothetical protein E3J72_11270 [Planctomycetota bacterium]|nr:MAG: hypothetical protein E3J72_11270 [Planctomycetota bacterium]